MVNLQRSMDASFHDLNVATPHTLHGSARSVPGQPAPLEGALASKALRIQQLSLLGLGFPLGVIPSYAPPISSSSSSKDLGSYSLQTILLRKATVDWWVGLVGQIRPKKLISSTKSEFYRGRWVKPKFKSIVKNFFDKSIYSASLCSQIALTSVTSVFLNLEKDGHSKKRRTRAMLYHKLPEHDITLEAAWPELFIDHNGKYWDVPESISLDCSSFVSESGFRYRFGIHKNSGRPRPANSIDGTAPASLMPGVCTKAAFSYEKSKDLWRVPETKEDLIVKTDKGDSYRPAYDLRMKEPHATISGIVGSTCEAWFGGRKDLVDMNIKRSPFSVDLFGSVWGTFQLGKFRKSYRDLTRLDAHLDISSASASAKGFLNLFRKSSASANILAAPRLNLILQQQVVGPIVFEVDSRFSLGSSGGIRGPHIEDVIYSLNYSLRLLRSGKVVAWYSPKRKEGMVELRVFPGLF